MGEDVIKGLVKKVMEVNENVKILASVVQNIANKSNYGPSDQYTLPDEVKLPLKSLEDVKKLECLLEENKSLKERQVS